ncbi:MAG TPA: dienelactone hydrolase family protein [Caulobacteraceae bacterium]|nr:dienelactone hydrolase family protein [Caulobacteraceae bacterium]
MLNLTRPEGSQPRDFHLSRRGVAAVFFSGYAAAAMSAEAEPIHTDEAGLVIEAPELPTQGQKINAYVARPKAAGRFPVVIVVNEVFGIHDYIKDICRRLAKVGYAAIAPNFFIRAGDPAPLADMSAVMKIVAQASDAQVMGDVGATLRFLKGRPWADASKVAVTGFCWGGKVVWLAAETYPEIKAGAAWYGRMAPPAGAAVNPAMMWPVQMAGKLKAPVLGLYGALDQGIPMESIEAMRAALAAAGKTGSEIVVYPDAGHGFHADYRPSYVATAANDGWKRMLAHFAANGVAPKAKAGSRLA